MKRAKLGQEQPNYRSIIGGFSMNKHDDNERIYLSTYILHKDNRVRLPKTIENNLGVVPGETYFDVFYDAKRKELILKKSDKESVGNKK